MDWGGCNLTGADLSGATLSGATLNDATITNANVAGTQFTGAAVTHLVTGGLTGTPASYPAAKQSIVGGYLVGPQVWLDGANLSGANLSDVDLTEAGLNGANLSGADLAGATLSRAVFSDTNLTGANLTGAVIANTQVLATTLTSANLSGVDLSTDSLPNVVSGGITNGPAEFPADFELVDGYLVGPWASLLDAKLPGVDLAGKDLSSMDLRGASLTSANLSGVNLTGTDLMQADLTDANLDNANLKDVNLGLATVTGATFTGAEWNNTTCPDGTTNSNKYVDGCFSSLDTTPPTATITGVKNGALYVQGAAPAAGCKTTADGTVATPASLTTTRSTTGFKYTVTCAGAVDLAGNKQAAPVSATYTVAPGMHGFVAPGKGATIARSAGSFVVRFKLTSSAGALYSTREQSAMAADNEIRMMLSGPGISSERVRCSWVESQLNMSCTIRIPSAVKTGSGESYELTAGENLGAGYIAVPAVGGTADPEVIHFK